LVDPDIIRKNFQLLKPELAQKIADMAEEVTLPPGKEILKEGQYIKVIPLVIEGLIKVSTRYEDKELLLYYIQPGESCIMSFSASLKNSPSKIFAITEETTRALLIPADKTEQLSWQYPGFSQLFFHLYNLRYVDLLDTINHLIYDTLDNRIYKYLQDKQKFTGKSIIQLTHRQIASELGTAREVITRLLKKLEKENKLELKKEGIVLKS